MTEPTSPNETSVTNQQTFQFSLRDIYIKIQPGNTGYKSFESSEKPYAEIPIRNSHPLRSLLERSLTKPIDVPWNKLELEQYTDFQRRVWRALSKIPPGQTRSYGKLAESIGKPRAAQATGQALKRNPYPILLPCHRVIKHDGSPGGYGGKINSPLKEKLLKWESS